jgi:hypothetical protein
MQQRIARIIYAPFFFVLVLLGTLAVIFEVASISVGGWIEAVLLRLGYRHKPALLPAFAGVIVFFGVGLVGSGYLGSRLIGWPGAIIGPILAIIIIGLIDRW